MGVMSALSSAVQIAGMFRTQNTETVVGTGGGKGFWNFYSNSQVGTLSMATTNVPRYIERLIERMMRDQGAEVKANRQSVIDNLQDISDFESYAYGQCDHMVNTVTYNKAAGTVFFYVYTFTPFMHATRGEACTISTMKILCNMALARDWMVVSKVKANFFKTTAKTEIRYLPEKGIQISNVIEAIAIAMAPAVLGLVQIPERFMVMLDKMVHEQFAAGPNAGIPQGPTPEQQAQIDANMKEMRDKQEHYADKASQAFKDLAGVLGGNKGPDASSPTADAAKP